MYNVLYFYHSFIKNISTEWTDILYQIIYLNHSAVSIVGLMTNILDLFQINLSFSNGSNDNEGLTPLSPEILNWCLTTTFSFLLYSDTPTFFLAGGVLPYCRKYSCDILKLVNRFYITYIIIPFYK